VVVHEGVLGLRVLLDIVIDTEGLQDLPELAGRAVQVAVLAAEAADDRACSPLGSRGVDVRGSATP
jgi:hypothetical protein